MTPIFNFCESIKEIRSQGSGRETGVSRGGCIETEWFQGANCICDGFVIPSSPPKLKIGVFMTPIFNFIWYIPYLTSNISSILNLTFGQF
jgi:hypothetical protein